MRPNTIEAILARYVVDETGCMIWTGALTSEGYAVASLAGRIVLVHRLAYEKEHGSVPEGLQLDHLCRKRPCINAAHLEAVESGENTRRGRNANREKTRCPNGHFNWARKASGKRYCRDCNRADSLRRYRALACWMR